jgi:hypothetical protein
LASRPVVTRGNPGSGSNNAPTVAADAGPVSSRARRHRTGSGAGCDNRRSAAALVHCSVMARANTSLSSSSPGSARAGTNAFHAATTLIGSPIAARMNWPYPPALPRSAAGRRLTSTTHHTSAAASNAQPRTSHLRVTNIASLAAEQV